MAIRKRASARISVNTFKPGDRVLVIGSHPWTGEVGELLRYERYGPASLAMEGWRVSLNRGIECYAREAHLERLS